MNRKQMYAGIRTDGEKIKPDYHNSNYAKYKQAKNPIPGLGTPDLFLTGKFYKTLDTELVGMTMKVKTGVDYGEKLRNKYPDIFGLTLNSLDVVQKKATTDFIELWKEKIK